MNGFKLKTKDNTEVRFEYFDEAPETAKAFDKALPFTLTIMHAKVSGQELWSNKAPKLDVIQENASVFAEPGEFVIAPNKPDRNKVKNCLGIFYGEGKLVDCCNIFAVAFAEDMYLLKELGEKIWETGFQEITFEQL